MRTPLRVTTHHESNYERLARNQHVSQSLQLRFDWQADIKRLPMKPKKLEGQYTCESKLKPLQSTWGEGQSNNSHFKYKYNVLAKLISWRLDGSGLQRESSQRVACSLTDCTDNSQPDLFLVTPYINLPLELTLFLFFSKTHTHTDFVDFKLATK